MMTIKCVRIVMIVGMIHGRHVGDNCGWVSLREEIKLVLF